jgi:hypothetical protein
MHSGRATLSHHALRFSQKSVLRSHVMMSVFAALIFVNAVAIFAARSASA